MSIDPKKVLHDVAADSIAGKWRTTEVNWDLIQRMRFANADAEIPVEDSLCTVLHSKHSGEDV